MNVEDAINAAYDAKQEGLLGKYPLAAQVLADEVKVLRRYLAIVAYPRRGTDEESLDIFSAAKVIQSQFTAEQLGA